MMEQTCSIVDSYPRNFQRFTWREQRNDQNIKILSPIYRQRGDTCAMFSIGASFEAKLKIKGTSVILSKVHLERLNCLAKIRELRRKSRVPRILVELIEKGVCSEHDYELGLTGRTYKIRSFEMYDVRDPVQLSRALKRLTSDGPLVAVMKISTNYWSCWTSKHIYRFDPDHPVQETVGDTTRTATHAVSVVGFSLEESVPCLECQDSRGTEFSRNGFLSVDITSIIELVSFVIC